MFLLMPNISKYINSVYFYCLSVDKGMSNYVGHESDLTKPIKTCLRDARKKIPKKMRKKSPVFMQATAGMRMLK